MDGHCQRNSQIATTKIVGRDFCKSEPFLHAEFSDFTVLTGLFNSPEAGKRL